MSDKSEKTSVDSPTGEYDPPRIITFDKGALESLLGPSISCTGFSGAVSNC